MNVTFRCPHCDQVGRVEFDAATRELACPNCAAAWSVPAEALRPIPTRSVSEATTPARSVSEQSVQLWQCLVCPSTELFIRKDFSQKLGVAIVALGFVISSIFWYYRMPLWTYGVLFATALFDVVLYFTVGNVLHCYRCQAQYRGVPGLENHGGFDLETHEKHRQQKIRLAEAAAVHPASKEG